MRRIALLLLAAAALIVAGCGNSDQNDYVKQLNAADAKATSALTNTSTTPTTPASVAKRFDSAADRLETVIDDYRAIDPPDDAKSAHAKTIAGTVGLVALFREIAADYRRAKTQAQLNALARRTTRIASEKPFKQLAAARTELEQAGYKVEK